MYLVSNIENFHPLHQTSSHADALNLACCCTELAQDCAKLGAQENGWSLMHPPQKNNLLPFLELGISLATSIILASLAIFLIFFLCFHQSRVKHQMWHNIKATLECSTKWHILVQVIPKFLSRIVCSIFWCIRLSQASRIVHGFFSSMVLVQLMKDGTSIN